MGFAVECGQRAFSRHSWRRYSIEEHRYKHNFRFRRLPRINGFAFGPLMFWRDRF